MSSPQDEVTYESLVNRWKKELRSTTVARIDPHFYQAMDQHLRSLAEEYQREHAVNPSAPKVMMLQDELRNLTRAREDIYDLREKKIAMSAIIATRGGNPDRTNFTRGENELYEELVRVLKEGRRALLKRGERDVGGRQAGAATGATPGTTTRGGPPAPLDPAAFEARPLASAVTAAVPVGGGAAEPPRPKEAPLPGAPPAPAAPTQPDESKQEDAPRTVAVDAAPASGTPRPKSGRVLVRVLAPVDPFMASDLRTYSLSPDDVVALPADAASVLVGRGLARAVTG